MPNRKASTLIPIIEKYVKVGSIIFSDKWSAYVTLNQKYQHYVVVHSRRFVKYNFFGNGFILKVTTNHVERVWVEVRKAIRGVLVKDVEKRVSEIPYRSLVFTGKTHQDKVAALFEDIKKLLERMRVGPLSVFGFSNGGCVIE